MKRRVQPLLLVLLAPFHQAVAQEQPLICFGNEPFWRLDLTKAGAAEFSTPDTERVDFVGVANPLEPRGESIWRGKAAGPDGGVLVAFLRAGACSDQMSDTVHPFAVNVSLPDGSHLAGCCRVPATPLADTTLENSTWRLTALPGMTLPGSPERNAVSLTFQAGRVQGFSGCNQFTGSYTLEGDRLTIDQLAGTMMACAEPAMSVEQAFQGAFSGTLIVSLAGNRLKLTPDNEGDPLQFEREAPPTLDANEWEVTSYNNGRQAVVGLQTDTRITLTFRDGQVSGDSGCNRFFGSFTAQGNTLEIQPLASTRKICEGKVMTQEREFLSALQSATTWTIVRGMLDVHRADGERVLTANKLNE